MLMEYDNALRFAADAHRGQVRKCGENYIAHPVRVAAAVDLHGGDPEVVIAALLHDVVEDCNISLGELRKRGASERVVAAVDAVSRRDGESYMDFVRRCAKNPDGRLIKACDLSDNMNENCPPSLLRRYEKAKAILDDIK